MALVTATTSHEKVLPHVTPSAARSLRPAEPANLRFLAAFGWLGMTGWCGGLGVTGRQRCRKHNRGPWLGDEDRLLSGDSCLTAPDR